MKSTNVLVSAVNFTDFCKNANLKKIKKALNFYNEEFSPEKVLDYFIGWEIIYDDRFYKNCKILRNNHSNGKWETTIVIHDDIEYMFAENQNCWQYLPKTFSEFISDVLRYEDFELLLSEEGYRRIYAS